MPVLTDIQRAKAEGRPVKFTGSGGKGLIGGITGVPGADEFLFGSDPGRKPRDVLTQFGLTGKFGGQDVAERESAALAQLLGREGAQQRRSAGARAAREGITGTGLAEDLFQNVDLNIAQTTADQLRNIRLSIFQQQLQALGIAAGQPREPGFLESIAPVAAKFIPLPTPQTPQQ